MWYFVHKGSGGTEWRGELGLDWEVNTTAYSDDFTPDETDAYELWDLWMREYGRTYEHKQLGKGWIPIYWSVKGLGALRIHEQAPFANEFLDEETENFLTHFTWPKNEDTGTDLRWTTLPVVDKQWLPGHADKGGFVQEATGWKPGALQPVVYLPNLSKAARLTP
jgi:hypothetical protein